LIDTDSRFSENSDRTSTSLPVSLPLTIPTVDIVTGSLLHLTLEFTLLRTRNRSLWILSLEVIDHFASTWTPPDPSFALSSFLLWTRQHSLPLFSYPDWVKVGRR